MSSKDPHHWTSLEVAAYLRSINLAEKYVDVFIREEINGIILVNLTKEELKDEPFCLRAFAPLKTVLGGIDALKKDVNIGAEVPQYQQPEPQPNISPSLMQLPQMQIPQDQDFGFHSVRSYPDPGPLNIPVGHIFPQMPPPPMFENGFNPDLIPKYQHLEEEHVDPLTAMYAGMDMGIPINHKPIPMPVPEESQQVAAHDSWPLIPLSSGGSNVAIPSAAIISEEDQDEPERSLITIPQSSTDSTTSFPGPTMPLPLSEFSLSEVLRNVGIDQKKKKKEKAGGVAVEPVGEVKSNPKYVEVSGGTDLSVPPTNWLDDDERVHRPYNPGVVELPSGEFKTSALTVALAEDITRNGGEAAEGIDFISPAENLRSLFTAPYTDENFSLSIHRVGQSLVIESFPGTDEAKKASEEIMMSKLLYYSILAEDQKSSEAQGEMVDGSEPEITSPKTPIILNSQGAESQSFGGGSTSSVINTLPGAVAPPSFYRNLKWHFQDLKILLGSDQLLMQRDNGSEIALKLQDASQSLAPIDALEYWVDNVMNNVPQVAICYHKDGITQGYQLINTSDLPSISKEASFEPQIVQEYAGNVLHWLKDNCTREAGSYILVREHGQLKLFDLSPMYEDMEAEESKAETAIVPYARAVGPARKHKRERPFAYPVAMLCLRMGSKLAESGHADSAAKALRLLQKAYDLLPAGSAKLKSQAKAHMATAHIVSRGRKKDTNPKKKKATNLESNPAVDTDEREQKMHDDEQRELGYSLASNELEAALRELREEQQEDTSEEQLLIRERLTHCYIELIFVTAACDDIISCLEWARKAELLIEESRSIELRGSSRVLKAPPGMEGSPSKQPESSGLPDSPRLAHAMIRLLESLGDLHQSICWRLTRKDEQPSNIIAPLQEALDRVLQSDHSKSSLLWKNNPLSDVVDKQFDSALNFYYSAAKHEAKVNTEKVVPGGIEVDYVSRKELMQKLGRTYNLWASTLMRGQIRLSKASQYLSQALHCFSSMPDDPAADMNKAAITMNLGNLMQKLAAEEADKKKKDEIVSSREEGFVNKAISYYTDAVKLLASQSEKTVLYNDALKNSAKAQAQLAIRYKHHFKELVREQPEIDYEKRTSDLLLSALKTFSVCIISFYVISEINNHFIKPHTQSIHDTADEASAYAHLAQLHRITLSLDYEPPSSDSEGLAKRNEQRFRLSEMYFGKANSYYSNIRTDPMFLKLRMEVTRLHMDQRMLILFI